MPVAPAGTGRRMGTRSSPWRCLYSTSSACATSSLPATVQRSTSSRLATFPMGIPSILGPLTTFPWTMTASSFSAVTSSILPAAPPRVSVRASRAGCCFQPAWLCGRTRAVLTAPGSCSSMRLCSDFPSSLASACARTPRGALSSRTCVHSACHRCLESRAAAPRSCGGAAARATPLAPMVPPPRSMTPSSET